MKSKFFQTEADRELWIKLNAEYQIEWEKNLTYFDNESQTHKPTLQARNPRTMEEALEVARNQLKWDEENKEKPRFTLEELLILNHKELESVRLKQHQEWCRKFEKL